MNVDELSNKELAACIDNAVRGIHVVRNREILKERLISGTLYEPLAEKYGLSVRQTQNIIYQATKQLLKIVKD